ncbi:MAG: DUF2459 domain-containing protein [Planctomycetes bacterium]|nr:DUF2459 domain-containing protein [Planctomycetota bacterium]
MEEPAVMTITVFNDGFHSGFIVPYDGMPIELDRQRGSDRVAMDYVEISYGEASWLQDLDRSALHAMRLIAISGDGMFMMVNHPLPACEGPEALRTRYWDLPVTAAGRDAFYAALDVWLDRTRTYVRPPDDPMFLYPSTHRYSVFANCHDFTIAGLKAMGFPWHGQGLIATSGGMTAAIRAGVLRLRRKGAVAIGP